jgi:hypothetical protein
MTVPGKDQGKKISLFNYTTFFGKFTTEYFHHFSPSLSFLSTILLGLALDLRCEKLFMSTRERDAMPENM